MKRCDIILICSLLLIALLGGMFIFLFFNKENGTVVVTVGGEKYARLRTDKDTELIIEGKNGTNKLVIKDGQVYVSEASCPDKICTKMGYLTSLDPIVCLPNGVVISFEEE